MINQRYRLAIYELINSPFTLNFIPGVSILRTGPDRRTGSFCLAIKVFIGLFYGPDRNN